MTLTRTELAEGLDWRARTWRRKYAEKDECVGYYSEGYAFFDTQAADALRSADAEIASLRAMLAEAEGALAESFRCISGLCGALESAADGTAITREMLASRASWHSTSIEAASQIASTLAAIRAHKEKTDA